MTQNHESSSPRRCAQCGAELPGDVTEDACPKCLLMAALETQPASCPDATVPMSGPGGGFRGLPRPGDRLGHYQIVSLLGQGGMGAVFDAEDLENGRRVALKVLGQSLDSPEARERFFREGRLAASINHPNSVYVFGTEEIGGTPVITMELVASGTLQHLVRDGGPLPIGKAVDSVLQIIAGLEAAHRTGILHRDVKPSNCFLDADGAVKIGDFGLSVSATIRTEPALTAPGAFLGTPAFSSPEQLRGDELNASSDMYSVGATLFYLLTGRTPFEGKNAVQLLAMVLEQRAPSPAEFRPAVPKGLANVVLRCLEKLPGERFRTYEDLRQALAPYSSAAPTPATLGLRFLAGVLDLLLLNMLIMAILIPIFGSPVALLSLAYERSPRALASLLTIVCLSLLYYALFDGLRGASLGKAICRLRVVGRDKGTPGFQRALVRAVFYMVLPALPYWCVYYGDPTAYLRGSSAMKLVMGSSFYLVLASLFCTVRRRNGFATVYDLLTQTRVISRAALPLRPSLVASELPPPATEARPTVGPYHVLEPLGESGSVRWFLAYDLRLLRKVWVRTVPSDTAAIPLHLRNLGRVGRLRWLAGRRSAEENWDAFEAVAGGPLLHSIEGRQPWDRVRFWLHDLSTEISTAEKDGTLPVVLALDRIWITVDGRAKLLDFPAPGVTSTNAGETAIAASPERPSLGDRRAEGRDFLCRVASAALDVPRRRGTEPTGATFAAPLPLHVGKFLDGLSTFANTEAILDALTPLLQKPTVVSRWRRTGLVAACAAFPLLVGVGMIFGIQFLRTLEANHPDVLELNSILGQRAAMSSPWMKGKATPNDRLIGIYIAKHFRQTITDSNIWSNVLVLSMITPESRHFAEQSVVDYSNPTERETQEAEAALKPYARPGNPLGFLKERWFPLVVVGVSLILYVGIPALVAALLFRGGLVLLALGVAVVRHDGGRASRLRTFCRCIVAWSPLLVAPLLVAILTPSVGIFWAGMLVGVIAVGLAVLSLTLPQRGLQDRLAGTWLVPR